MTLGPSGAEIRQVPFFGIVQRLTMEAAPRLYPMMASITGTIRWEVPTGPSRVSHGTTSYLDEFTS